MDSITKKCTKCGEEKDVSKFYKNKLGKYGVDSKCAVCGLKYSNEYRKKFPEKVHASAKTWRLRNPEKVRDNELKRAADPKRRERRNQKHREWSKNNPEKTRQNQLKVKYKIDNAEFNVLLERQGGRCAICHGDNRGKVLCVDHNHETGKLRGLLCNECNHAIGLIYDRPFLADAMSVYLRKNI